MIRQVYHVEFLTPCFCAGAQQNKAELRAPAIRGQLRWWFRALGGSRDEELAVFGGVHQDPPRASKLKVRIVQPPAGGDTGWHQQIPPQGAGPLTYLWGFFTGRTGRLNPAGAMAPGSRAVVEVLLAEPPNRLLGVALQAFFSIGALGFRATRAAGALTSEECALAIDRWEELKGLLTKAGFQVVLLSPVYSNWLNVATAAGELLKNKLRGRAGLGISAGQGGQKANALGSAKPRQASVLHLRPVRIHGQLRLALLEAPHERILGREARRAHGNRGTILAMAAGRRALT